MDNCTREVTAQQSRTIAPGENDDADVDEMPPLNVVAVGENDCGEDAADQLLRLPT